MTKKVFLIFLISIVFFSCKKKHENLPSYIIPKEKFIYLLVDYHLAQGISSTYDFRKKTKQLNKISLCDSVIIAYGYTRAMFDSSIMYYSKNIKEFDEIYEKVITELNRMQAKEEAAKDISTDNKTK